MRRYRCPKCKSSEHLWEAVTVSGWRGLDETLTPTGEREADWVEVFPEAEIGCSGCDWRGSRSDLQPIGIDGEPLPEIHPLQGSLL